MYLPPGMADTLETHKLNIHITLSNFTNALIGPMASSAAEIIGIDKPVCIRYLKKQCVSMLLSYGTFSKCCIRWAFIKHILFAFVHRFSYHNSPSKCLSNPRKILWYFDHVSMRNLEVHQIFYLQWYPSCKIWIQLLSHGCCPMLSSLINTKSHCC